MGGDGEEKTEQPTQKKIQDARKEGNVLQSRDAATLLVLLGVFTVIRVAAPYIWSNCSAFLRYIIDQIGNAGAEAISGPLFYQFIVIAVSCSAPGLLAAMVLGIIAHGAQTRFNVAFKAVKPNFGKMNPISGVKRMFSLRSFVEFLKNLIKIMFLIIFLYTIIKDDILPISRMLHMSIMSSVVTLMGMLWDLVIRVAMAFAAIAFFDFMYQRWQYNKDLMMTKQEVKDEYKMTEGNPEVKNKMKQAHRQMSNQRMMQDVPTADVVVRNPTHVAVALKYDPKQHAAPFVVAKGLDHIALRIIEVAEENNVPWVENKPLARSIYSACEVGQMIPSEYYGVVAELLVYIYRQEHKEELLR
ncbi:MAG: flagellar biosynthesis protein FlhB [Clostridium sp.]|nr:flagellar biosynthesis protein FlhB [Clostridium sp.]